MNSTSAKCPAPEIYQPARNAASLALPGQPWPTVICHKPDIRDSGGIHCPHYDRNARIRHRPICPQKHPIGRPLRQNCLQSTNNLALSHFRCLDQHLTANGQVLIQTTEVAFEELVAKLQAIAAERRDGSVYVRADGAVPYERFAQVMAALKAGGFSDVGLVTDPNGPRLDGSDG